METARKVGTALAAALLLALLSGGTCQVVYCSDGDCDPCVEQCKCHKTCQTAAFDFETAHRVAGHRLTVLEEPDGSKIRVVSEIVGLSLAFVPGAHERTVEDHVRFARGVIEVNAELLDASGGSWEPGTLQVFETAVAVPFRRVGSGDSLSFLFDRHGNLVEIDGIRRPAAPADR